MQPVRALLIYLFVVFIGAALIAPFLYFGVQEMAVHYPAMEKLARNPFHRFVNRSLLILAVVGLWPLFRQLGMRNWADLGFADNKWLSRMGFGVVLGLGSLAVAAAILFITGVRTAVSADAAGLTKHLINAGLAALIVAPLEELIFRGALFGGIRKVHPWKMAVVVSSAVYALVHFFNKPAPPETVIWSTGFTTLGLMLRGFIDLQSLIPGLINLLLAGAILALGYQSFRSLYFSIGLHAGWIFWLKSFSFFTAPSKQSLFWGSGKLIDGWAATIVLVPILVAFMWFDKKRRANESAY